MKEREKQKQKKKKKNKRRRKRTNFLIDNTSVLNQRIKIVT